MSERWRFSGFLKGLMVVWMKFMVSDMYNLVVVLLIALALGVLGASH